MIDDLMYDFDGVENHVMIRCVVCNMTLPDDSSGLCPDHQYDEQRAAANGATVQDFVTPAGVGMQQATSRPPCPVCGRLLPALLARRVVVHTGLSGIYACAGHDAADYDRLRLERLAEYDR